MEFRITSSSKRRLAQRAFTLSELLIGIGLAGLVVTIICAIALYSGINFAALANYADLDSNNVNALDRITRDVRSANGTTAINTNSITFSTDSGVPLTYNFSSADRTLTRSQGANSLVVLREVDSLKFYVYQRTPVSNSFNQYAIGDTNETKVVFVTWTCSRTIFGRKTTTDSSSAGRVAMRVN